MQAKGQHLATPSLPLSTDGRRDGADPNLRRPVASAACSRRRRPTRRASIARNPSRPRLTLCGGVDSSARCPAFPISAPDFQRSSRSRRGSGRREKDVDGAKILEAARAAEAAGFAWVSCSDHPAVPVSRAQAMGPTWFDAGSTLAFVAGVTTRIRLMPHVVVLPYRHPLGGRETVRHARRPLRRPADPRRRERPSEAGIHGPRRELRGARQGH